MSQRHAILLVDDHPIVREGLSHVIHLESDLFVCGEAASADAAMTLAAEHKPALALVDLSLGDKPDVTLVRRLREKFPKMLVLAVSMHDETIWAARALKAGACGYVMKQESSGLLIQRIRQALCGFTAVNDSVASTLLRQLTWGRDLGPGNERTLLGEREAQVLQMLGTGQSSRDIAGAMGISVKTVEAHREHIKHKLGLRTAAELIHYAVLQREST